jgi:uncharacterized protein (TIGR02145 family)
MQESGAYFNESYTTSSYPHQGICPEGWHIPTGGTIDNNEFAILDKATGGTGTGEQSGASYTNFWKPSTATTVTATDPWKSIYSGMSTNAGSISAAGAGYWVSSTESGIGYAYGQCMYTTSTYPLCNTVNKNYGFAVRCIKD